MRFKTFLQNEGNNIFGFDNADQDDIKTRSPNIARDDGLDMPMRRLDTGRIANLLCQTNLGEKQPLRLFFDSIRWGQGPGSVRIKFGTRYSVMIERMNYDLVGQPIWVTKRVFDVNNEKFAGKEEGISLELKKALKEVDQSDVDSPINNYDCFDRLAKSIAYKTGRVCNDPLFFETVQKLNEHEYIIKFGLKGQGIQARNQHRVEQVEVHLVYHRKQGTIQAMRLNVESRLGCHDWLLQPNDFEFCFVPTQPHEEIVDCLSTVMKYY
jgi:hypothetical protein